VGRTFAIGFEFLNPAYRAPVPELRPTASAPARRQALRLKGVKKHKVTLVKPWWFKYLNVEPDNYRLTHYSLSLKSFYFNLKAVFLLPVSNYRTNSKFEWVSPRQGFG